MISFQSVANKASLLVQANMGAKRREWWMVD